MNDHQVALICTINRHFPIIRDDLWRPSRQPLVWLSIARCRSSSTESGAGRTIAQSIIQFRKTLHSKSILLSWIVDWLSGMNWPATDNQYQILDQCWYNVGPTLRRWPNIAPALIQFFVDQRVVKVPSDQMTRAMPGVTTGTNKTHRKTTSRKVLVVHKNFKNSKTKTRTTHRIPLKYFVCEVE